MIFTRAVAVEGRATDILLCENGKVISKWQSTQASKALGTSANIILKIRLTTDSETGDWWQTDFHPNCRGMGHRHNCIKQKMAKEQSQHKTEHPCQ